MERKLALISVRHELPTRLKFDVPQVGLAL
jgi:hypothetical protein